MAADVVDALVIFGATGDLAKLETFPAQPGEDMRPYDRLIGAALDGDRWLFAEQDTVEAAWRVVDPVLGDVTPVHPYAKGTWGPKEADRLLPHRDAWHDPA
jgi:glucose-6-phosphate 1-dehydrogenase